MLFERATFLVISHSTNKTHRDVHRFEKISNIIKQFKLSCRSFICSMEHCSMQRTVDATCNANVHPPVREDRHRSCAPLVSRAASTRRTLRGPDRSLLTVQQDTGALPGHGGAQFELHRIHRCLHIQHVCFFPDRFAQFTLSFLLTIIRHRSTSNTKIAQRSAAAYAASCKRCGAGASRASCPTVAHAACSDVAVPWQVHHGHHVRSVDPARCDEGQYSGPAVGRAIRTDGSSNRRMCKAWSYV